jgi:iron complex transport system permease protein
VVGLFAACGTTLFALELTIGSVAIPLRQVLAMLAGAEPARASWDTILFDLRLPRALTAVVASAALAVGGLQMQTLFRNPLAGPWALGVTAGAQLGVALMVVAGSAAAGTWLAVLAPLGAFSLAAAATVGAVAILLLILALARRVSPVTLLVVGLMLGYASDGLVSVVLHFSDETRARVFANWSDGSFGAVTWSQLAILLPVGLGALFLVAALAKPLNGMLLGERYARSLGVEVGRTRLLVLGSAVVLSAATTAYCGVVGFLDLAVPHLCRGLLRTADHRILVPAVALAGASLGLAADLFVHLPWDRHFLHLNAVNALVGVPVVLWVVLRARSRGALEL